jgi:uncharacterized protein YndB with AHSA1/START domain
MPPREMVHAVAACLLLPLGVAAEVKQASPDGFVLEHRFAIDASPTVAWEVLVHPERYWPDDHTWSGRAANMSLAPEAGGCFCERWAEGSAEHGRVIMAVPGKMLRFRGALGPFQDMAVTGVMTVALAPGESGTEAVVTYRVNGTSSQRLGEMATAVDAVVRQQFAGFAALASRPRD